MIDYWNMRVICCREFANRRRHASNAAIDSNYFACPGHSDPVPDFADDAVRSSSGTGQVAALAPKPAQLTPYTAPHKPHWQLSEVLAQNAGKPGWTVTVVDDAHLKAQYISMAPGESTPKRFYADNPAWWVVQDGQIRFTIDGQEPSSPQRVFWCRCLIGFPSIWKRLARSRCCDSK